ncbi:MAG: peptidylprolyl isomerase [Gammaproteobacteria bacterium]|nr:MAG: peptidylprolyl isomerase [Gammaproteobacteria bacterium]
MLLAIREKAQGWFAWLIVAFITIPFALWGIQSYLGVGEEPVVASVDGTDITQREVEQQVRQMRERLRTQLGKSYRPELFSDEMLRKQVVEQLVNEAVLRETVKAWNLRVSDDFVRRYIRSIPYFQTNGKFNVEAYNIAVRNQGMTQRSFEESVRMDLVMEQLQRGIIASALATDREVNDLVRLRDQQREVAWLVVSGKKLLEGYTPTEEELKAYYEAHKEQWLIPERVKVEYLLLDPEVVGSAIEVTEEKLREYWRQHQDEFQAPEERRVRHILIAAPEGADAETEAEAKARVEDIYERLQKGEKFEELAKALSEDPGSKEQGGDLGWISPGIMAKAFEEAAYALQKGEISKPVRTPFGFHVLQVVDIKSGGEGGFEAMRDRVEAAYRRQQAEQLLFDKAEKLADLTYENPDSLEVAAEELGLKVQQSDWFDRNGGIGPLASPKVVGAAFSEDVLQEGHNSELIELDEDRVLVLRVVEHEAEQIPPFEQVKEKVTQALKREKASELARKEGEALVAAVNSGDASLEKLAQEKGWKYIEPAFLGRQATQVPAAVVKKAFELPRPDAGKASVAGTDLGAGDYAVLVVQAVKDGDPASLDEAARKREMEQLASRKGNAQFNLMGRFLREKADVEITQEK